MPDPQDRTDAVRRLRERVFSSSEPGVDPDVVAASREEQLRLIEDQDFMPELSCEPRHVAPGKGPMLYGYQNMRSLHRRIRLGVMLRRYWWVIPILVVAIRFVTAYRRERTR